MVGSRSGSFTRGMGSGTARATSSSSSALVAGLGLASLVFCVSPRHAFADPPSASATPAAPAAGTPAAPSPEELADARRIFAVGIQHADRGEWEDAVVCFRQVLEVREAPPVLFNLGAALVSLGQYPEAEPLLRRVVEDPSAESSLVERARASLTTMETRGGRVTLRLVDPPASAVVYVDGKVLASAQIGIEVPMSAGEHELVVRAAGRELTRRTVRVAVGDHAEVVITLDASSSTDLADQDSLSAAEREALAARTELGTGDRAARRRQRLRSPWLWTGVGAGVVLIVAVVIVATHEPSVDSPVQGNSNPPLVRF